MDTFFGFPKSSEDCCIRTLRLPDFLRIVFRSNRFMQIFLKLQNFASYQNFRAPTILVKQFCGEKQIFSPAFLIQIEGQEEQQEHEQRGGGQAAKGAAGRAAGGKEKQEIEEEQNDPDTEYWTLQEQFLARIWDPEYYSITRKKKFHKYLLFDLKTVGQNSGSGRELLQEYFAKTLDVLCSNRIFAGFTFHSNFFFKIVLYWYSPAARFVAGHFADQIEDIPWIFFRFHFFQNSAALVLSGCQICCRTFCW